MEYVPQSAQPAPMAGQVQGGAGRAGWGTAATAAAATVVFYSYL